MTNFRCLLSFRALSGDLTLKVHLMNLGKSAYISLIIQNEILQKYAALLTLIQKEILLKINQANFLTILADETYDIIIYLIEQMSLCVRYINDGCI